MSGLKSAWELSLEKSEKLVPELKGKKKISAAQKKKIGALRSEYKAKIADKEIMLQTQMNQLGNRFSPEEVSAAMEELKEAFAKEKKGLEAEMENKIEEIRNKSD